MYIPPLFKLAELGDISADPIDRQVATMVDVRGAPAK